MPCRVAGPGGLTRISGYHVANIGAPDIAPDIAPIAPAIAPIALPPLAPIALAIAFIRLAQEVPNCELLALSFFRAFEEMEFARSRVGPVRQNR